MRRREVLRAIGVGTVASLAGCAGGGGGETAELPFERDVDPTRTYLRVSGDDAGDAEPVDIGSLGVQGGSQVRIVRQGSFTGSSGGLGMTAVFSGSGALSSGDQRERVVDALDAGEDYETSATFNGGQATDISEDFLVADNGGEQTSVTVTVPDGATHLFVAAIDNYYQDNGQGDPPFGVRIEDA